MKFEFDNPPILPSEELADHIRGLFRGAAYHQGVIDERRLRGHRVPKGDYLKVEDGFYKLRLHEPVYDETLEADTTCDHSKEEMKIWLLMTIPAEEHATSMGIDRSDPDEVAEITDSFEMHVKMPGLPSLRFLVDNESIAPIDLPADLNTLETQTETSRQELAQFWLDIIQPLSVMAVAPPKNPTPPAIGAEAA